MTPRADDIFEFGDCRLEASERLLLRAGEVVPLTPKVFDTLLVLVKSGGRLVRKDDLIKEVWPDTVVEDANLARNVWTLRRALGESDGERRYIETIPKIGYRFVASVRQGATPATERTAPPMEIVMGASTPRIDAGTQPAAPRRPAAWRPPVLAVATAAAIGLAVVGLAAFLWTPTASFSAPGAEPGIRFLTDGRHDDVGPSWGGGGRIYFSRLVTDTRVETWRMKGDGSGLERANQEIPALLNGRWSPDGQRLVFVKESEPAAFYLANADGSNESRLPFVPGNLDWSPDSTRFVYQFRTATGSSAIAVYDVAAATSVVLADHATGNADPSFSPDGARVAFTSWRDANAEIYVMDADGSNVRRLTNHPAFDNYPVFSPDGTQIAYQSNREDEHVEVYLQNLDGDAPARRLTRSSGITGLAPKAWSADGTELLVFTNRNGRDQVAVIKVDAHPVELVLEDSTADLRHPRVSVDGTALLYEARMADQSAELRLTDLQKRRTRRLFRTEPGHPPEIHLTPAWSPDNTLIAFAARVDGNSEIVTIRSDGTGFRILTKDPRRDSNPVFTADGREIIFPRDEFGRAQLYRMDLNGHGQRRVTNAPGYELNPATSADGRFLAFAGDRSNRGLDILLHDLTKPGNEVVMIARSSHDEWPAFSLDGRQIAFVANSDGNEEVYLARTDGLGVVRLTRERAQDTSPQFMPDGRSLVFSSRRSGKFAIYRIALPERP